MYDAFFGLKKRPFTSLPQTDQYFPATSIEAARIALARCIERGEGVGMVIGPTGTGKTLLCRLLYEQCKKTFAVVELSCGRLSTRRSLYQTILYGLDQPFRDMDEGELRLSLVDYLSLGKAPQRGMVLIVDEAHTLPTRLLDEIRMLTNLAFNGLPLVRLVLAANASLEERFASPKMESFNQRICARCYLEAFNRSETQDYIHAQIDSAGGCGADLFPENACQSVYQATDGVPRLINQLCDHALLLSYVAGRRVIEPAKIDEAWTDLQQLPTPWNGDSQHAHGGVIEFGRFDDSPPESSQKNADEDSEFPSLRVAEHFEEAEESSFELGNQDDSIKSGPIGAENDFQPAGSIKPEIELTFVDGDFPFQEEFEQEEVITDRYAALATTTSPLLQSSAAKSPADWSKAEKTDSETLCLDHTETLELNELNTSASLGASESSVVAVEDGQHRVQSKPKAVATVRRHEYSRLFAKLRQR